MFQKQDELIEAIKKFATGNAVMSPSNLLLSFDRRALRFVTGPTLLKFATLPYILTENKPPSFREVASPSTVIQYLLGAAKQELVSDSLTFEVSSKWEAPPNTYYSIFSYEQAQVFLENHLGQEPVILLPIIGKIIKKARNVDVHKMSMSLSKSFGKKNYPELVERIITSGTRLGWNMKEVEELLSL